MSTPRFYCPSLRPSGDTCELPPEAARHAHRVLRLRVNDPVQVFDGEGSAFDAVIGEIGGERAVLGKLKPCASEPPPPLHIVLAQSLCGSEKMDWVIQKAIELGAAEIQPVHARRSVAKLSGERLEKRIEHWHSVAIAACEQSRRNRLPQIHAPQEFSAWMAEMRNITGAKFILLPEGSSALQGLPRPGEAVTLLIGPEGGFTADEARIARQAGFVPIRLGPRILRTETAAMAGIAALQILWGDIC